MSTGSLDLDKDVYVWDLLWFYQTKPDALTGQSVISAEAFVEVRSVHPTTGRLGIRILSGGEYLSKFPEMRMVRVGNRVHTTRQQGMVVDTVTPYGPRNFFYKGVDSPGKFMSSSTFIDCRGNLKSIYDEDFGGWLTIDGIESSIGLEGYYFKNLFAKGRFVFVGDSYFKGNVIIAEGGVVKNINAGVGGNGVVWNEDGIKGYDEVLGMTFYLPTDGSKPQFSSGIISEVIYEITTNSVMRTSANVGTGDAGALINNTGIYVCAAGQSLANADIILTPTLKKFTGNVYVTGGNVIVTGESAADINSHPTTVSGTKITDNSITVDKLYVTSLSGISANLGTVTSGLIKTVALESVTITSSAIEVSAGYGITFKTFGAPPYQVTTVGALTATIYLYWDGVSTQNVGMITSGAWFGAPVFVGSFLKTGATGNRMLATSAVGWLVETGVTPTQLSQALTDIATLQTTVADHASRIATLEAEVFGIPG